MVLKYIGYRKIKVLTIVKTGVDKHDEDNDLHNSIGQKKINTRLFFYSYSIQPVYGGLNMAQM